MPSLKEIKGRIASVNSTRKITSAMKMVASSKLHHAQVAIQNMLPYETMLEHILKSFLAAEAEAHTVFSVERPVKRVALVVFSSNSSLCGGFNANVIKLMQKVVNDYCEQGATGVEIYPIGRKVAEKAGKLAMQTATDNADELLRELNYSKPSLPSCWTLSEARSTTNSQTGWVTNAHPVFSAIPVKKMGKCLPDSFFSLSLHYRESAQGGRR